MLMRLSGNVVEHADRAQGLAGSVLLSPSMCKQAAEHGWLQPFQSKISKDWEHHQHPRQQEFAAGIYADIVSMTLLLAIALSDALV